MASHARTLVVLISVWPVVLGLALGGCGKSGGKPGGDAQAQARERGGDSERSDGSPDTRRAVHVGTTEELLGALGPDRVIVLEAGEYVLPGPSDDAEGDHSYTHKFEGLVFLNLKNTTFRCEGEEPAVLLAEEIMLPVLTLKHSEGVTFENIRMGHVENDDMFCAGVVLACTGCKNLTLDSCGLFGCGGYGLDLNRVDGLRFQDSSVYDCKFLIVQAVRCTGLEFTDSEFRDNRLFSHGFSMTDCGTVRMTRCRAWGNTRTRSGPTPLFDIDNFSTSGETPASISNPTRVELVGCDLQDAGTEAFANKPELIVGG